MKARPSLEGIYEPSEDVVAREIEDEFLIVPLTSGIGNIDEELFNLNDTGTAIWKRLDGRKSLRDVVIELSAEFEAPVKEIEEDAMGFVEELLKRGMLVEVSND